MLTKTDLQNIDKLIQKRVKSAISDGFAEFYEKIFQPFMERNDQEHEEMAKNNMKEHEKTREEIGEYIKDHEKRIRKTEVIIGSN